MMNATRKQLVVSGIIQLIIGIFCFIFGIVERVPASGSGYYYDYHLTITSLPCLGIWMGLWIGITGLLGIFTKSKAFKPVTGVYLGFTITSVVFAATMIICYSLSLAIFYSYYRYGYGSYYSESRRRGYVMSILILILSILEFGIGIWASVCCCMAFGRGQQPSQTGVAGQVVYMQTQVGGPATPHVIIQGPGGNPIAVPAQISGPTIEQSAIPPHYSNPTFQQQPPQQDVTKVPLS